MLNKFKNTVSKNFFPDQNIKELFSEGDVYDIAKNIQGKIFREAANRVTKEFTHNGISYFIKFHEGIGWAEVFKNLLKIRLPTVGAKTEWKAINKLRELDIDCPEVAAVCYKGINPANSQSFIITKSLVNTTPLKLVSITHLSCPTTSYVESSVCRLSYIKNNSITCHMQAISDHKH